MFSYLGLPDAILGELVASPPLEYGALTRGYINSTNRQSRGYHIRQAASTVDAQIALCNLQG
jgi:hypothetical protein